MQGEKRFCLTYCLTASGNLHQPAKRQDVEQLRRREAKERREAKGKTQRSEERIEKRDGKEKEKIGIDKRRERERELCYFIGMTRD